MEASGIKLAGWFAFWKNLETLESCNIEKEKVGAFLLEERSIIK